MLPGHTFEGFSPERLAPLKTVSFSCLRAVRVLEHNEDGNS